jgi:hypothetical protein
MRASKKEAIPSTFDGIDEAADFWDTHSLADYTQYLKPASVTFKLTGRVHLLAVDPEIASQLRAISRAHGLSPETVANLWLRERLASESKRRRRPTRAA